MWENGRSWRRRESRGQILRSHGTHLLAFFLAYPTDLVHALGAHSDEDVCWLEKHSKGCAEAQERVATDVEKKQRKWKTKS